MADSLGDVVSPVGTLRCTLRAAKEVNAIYGSYSEVFRRLAAFDLSAYIAVAAAGLGKKATEVEQEVFAAGMDALVDPISEFVGFLSRGGRPLPEKDAEPAPGEA